jgi:hypothetical protein
MTKQQSFISDELNVKKHGTFLILLYSIYLTSYSIQSIEVFYPITPRGTYLHSHTVLFTIFFIALIMGIAGLFYSYRWHKWGLCLLVSASLVKFLDFIFVPIQYNFGAHLVEAIVISLTIFAANQKWSYFT